MMWRVYVRDHPTLGPWYVRAQRARWPALLAGLTVLAIVTVPLLLLLFLAGVAGVAVFVIASIVQRVVYGVRSVWDRARPDGRRNVRVIDAE